MIFGAFCSGITLTQACYKTLYILFRDRRALVWTIANKIEAFARAAQRGTTSRHSWTISTFTRFSRFSRFPTRKQKRSLRRLRNRRLRETFIEPFAFLGFSRVLFVCLRSFFRHLALFSVRFSSRPPLSPSTWDANEVMLQALASFLDTFHCTQNLTCRKRGTVVNTGTLVLTWASNEFFRQLFGWIKALHRKYKWLS